MKYYMLIFCLIVFGCTENYPKYSESHEMDYYCSESIINNKSEFILTCINNANPKSDEEPEDWLKICEEMALNAYCEKVSVIKYMIQECNGCYTKVYDMKYIDKD